MIEELKTHRYRGVLCLSCRQPIPLPAIVNNLEAERKNDENEMRGALVFTLRCRSCDKEQPYRASEIVDFDGPPKSRYSRTRRTRLVGPGPDPLSHAANA
jgi:hypothetical protein